jgi:NAD(P)H-hydrate epimerase
MREIQRVAQEEYGVDILQIMENAGRAVATLALAMLGGKGRGQRVVVLCGGGNTGGAGLSAVRHLVNYGIDAEGLFAEVESEMTSFLARRQLQILRAAGIMSPRMRSSASTPRGATRAV